MIRLLVLVAAVLSCVARAQPTLPLDPPRGEARIAVFGDFNGPYGSTSYPAPVARTVRAITETWRPDLLLSPGDVIAGQDGSLPDERFDAMWDAFDRAVAGPLRAAAIPYAVAMGNHDASGLRDAAGSYRFGREREAARAYWNRPMYASNLAYLPGGERPFAYAFRAGGIFVAVIDATSAQAPADGRGRLAEALASPEARDAELRVVVGHLPLVPVARGRDAPGEFLPPSDPLRAVLEEGRADLYVSGHQAAYYPGRLGELELLFAGGVGARPLLGGGAPPRSTVTLVDVWYDPLDVRYTTFDAATLEPVPHGELPERIATGGHAVERSARADPRSGTLADAEGVPSSHEAP